MKPSEIISKMREEGRDTVAHILVGSSHEYYVTPAELKNLSEEKNVQVLNWGTNAYLRSEDVVGKVPRSNKKALYQLR